MSKGKENSQNFQNAIPQDKYSIKYCNRDLDNHFIDTMDFSTKGDLCTANKTESILFNSFYERELLNDNTLKLKKSVNNSESIITVSSATHSNGLEASSERTVSYSPEEALVKLSFDITKCNTINVSAKDNNIHKVSVRNNDKNVIVDSVLVEKSHLYICSDDVKEMNDTILTSPRKRSAETVNLEIKKIKLSTEDATENSKVLILNTDAIEKLPHVIVQSPNYKLVKRKFLDRSQIRRSDKRKSLKNRTICSDNLKQKFITDYLCKGTNVSNSLSSINDSYKGCKNIASDDAHDMSKNFEIADVKCDRGRTHRSARKNNELSPKSAKIISTRREQVSKQDIKASNSDAPRFPSPGKNDSLSFYSPRKNLDVLQLNIPGKPKLKTSPTSKPIPHYKIVAGTHFAVDAFSYGDIPNVKHYFLTHFHSDHYTGLKRNFNKFLFCSKITADLCISRLGVNPKYIQVINIDETIRLDGVEITAVDANHCPGAIMLIFTLQNAKTILHTGDFRATPVMESYPIFWNADIHTIYLDTTYCNPRYDFPTQEQSLEMALHLLHQKKVNLEKAGKKFSSVLIVCGTYTIGKEKFFLGMARQVGCSVWACPEKDKILQAVEGRSFSTSQPQSCQLHVVPMRDLTHEKLRCYLDSLQGAFSEVVAFKPSGWENGKNSAVEKDMVTIHGIPYSEHSSFSEMIRFVKYLKPKQVVPTVDISGGTKSVQKYFPCPLVCKEDIRTQSRVTDYFCIHNRQQVTAVT